MRLVIMVLSAACVALYGHALAGYAGNFFGRGRPSYVLWGLLLGTACGAAALYLWKKWLRATTPDMLIFDVDGVLIDTRGSYLAATAEAVRWCWENVLGGTTDCEGYTAEYHQIAKLHPAFNDDSAIAWVLLRAMLRTGRKSMKEAFPSIEAWKKELGAFASDAVVEDIAKDAGETPSLNEVRTALEEIYFGAELYAELKGKPGALGKTGTWKRETPGTSRTWQELGLPVGIYTGRSRDEMTLGYKVMNWSELPDGMLVSSGDGMWKPSPEGLKILCERAGAKYPVFFGDTASDLHTWRAFGDGMFIAIGPVLKTESKRGEFLHFDTLEEALSSLLP